MPDKVDTEIGNRIRQLRLRRECSLVELSEQVGVSYQQIRKYELGTNRISATTLLRVSQALDVDVGFFFDGLADRQRTIPASEPSADPSLDEALHSIDDDHLRLMLRGLIIALRTKRR